MARLDRKEHVDALIAEIIEIDASEMSRSDKTKAARRAATKLKNRLHDSKKIDDDERIALSTYRKYITEARRAVTAQNWKHHSLQDECERLARKYPQWAADLRALPALDITPLRLAHKALLDKVKAAEGAQRSDAFADLRAMKLDHEVMRWLTLADNQAATLGDQQAAALEQAKNAIKTLNYHDYLARVTELLTLKTKTRDGAPAYEFGRLALGVACATGRRQIEVVYQGEFRKVDADRLMFSGQAKRRGGADYSDEYMIYSLVSADVVIAALDALRGLPECQALQQFDDLEEVERNTQINIRVQKTLNSAAKKFFGDAAAMFKDSRMLYARACFDRFYKTDPRWKGKDEDIFWRELLGHQDLATQQAYKAIQFDYTKPAEPAALAPATNRLEALRRLDDAVAARRALAKLHQRVKEAVVADPALTITKNFLIYNIGAGRAVINDYLELAGDALAMRDKLEAVRVKRKPVTTAADEPAAKPTVTAVQAADGSWIGEVIVGGRVVASATSGARMEAQREAWQAWRRQQTT